MKKAASPVSGLQVMRSMVVKLPVSAPRRAMAAFRVFMAASGSMPACKNCSNRRQVRADSRRAASPLPMPSASSRHRSPPSVRKETTVSPQTVSPSLGRRAAPMRQRSASPAVARTSPKPAAVAVSSSLSWAYWPLALRRVSSSCRRYCRRSRNAESSPLTAVRKSGRWMHRSAK